MIPIEQFKRILKRMPAVVERATQTAMRRTAQYGRAAVKQRTIALRISASRTYIQGWRVQKTTTGALLYNPVRHAYFVEVGRRPGTMPPLDPLVRWAIDKRIARRKAPRRRRKTSDEGKRRGKRAGKKRSGKKRTGAKRQKKESAFVIAARVRWKIFHYGFRGKYVLRDTMPAIQNRARKEVKQAVMKSLSRMR